MQSKAPKHRADIPTPSVDIITDGPVLVLGGDLDVRSTAEVRAAVHEHLRLHGDDLNGLVVLDISRVASVDATALKVLAVAKTVAPHRCAIWTAARPTPRPSPGACQRSRTSRRWRAWTSSCGSTLSCPQ